MNEIEIENKLRAIGRIEGLADVHLETFIVFFKNNFPDHMDGDYAEQWAERFKNQTMFVSGISKDRALNLVESYREGVIRFWRDSHS